MSSCHESLKGIVKWDPIGETLQKVHAIVKCNCIAKQQSTKKQYTAPTYTDRTQHINKSLSRYLVQPS